CKAAGPPAAGERRDGRRGGRTAEPGLGAGLAVPRHLHAPRRDEAIGEAPCVGAPQGYRGTRTGEAADIEFRVPGFQFPVAGFIVFLPPKLIVSFPHALGGSVGGAHHYSAPAIRAVR